MTHSLMLRPHEFSQDAGVVNVDSGQSLRAMLMQACGGAEVADDELDVRVGGHFVPSAYWSRITPKPGTAIHVTRRGLNGATARQIVAVVAQAALIYFTFGAGTIAGFSLGTASAAGTFAVQAGVYMLGSLAISALTKPPTQGGGGQSETTKWNALTGTSNQISPWGVIPFVIGESRFFPPHAAFPYSEAIGESSYQYCLFDLGYGDIEVSDIRIGETSISQYKEVTYEITKTPTIYTNDVSEVAVGSAMEDGDVVIRTTAPGVTRIALDIIAPSGLYGVGTSGKKFSMNVTWNIQYRETGTTGSWITPSVARLSSFSRQVNTFKIEGQRENPFSAGIGWDVPEGQYDVRVTRVTTSSGSSKNTYVSSFTWSSLRSIKPGLPSTTGTNKLAMRIMATDQLNGTLQTLSCIVKQKIKTYDRSTNSWSSPVFNLNPAWVTYWLLTECPAFGKKVDQNRIQLDTFSDYAEFCETNSMEARGVVDSSTTALDLIENVLSCSLGSLGQRDGKYSVVFDSGETIPSMVFTPLEIDDFILARPFTIIPDAIRVQFKNPDADYQQDEVVVLNDGFSYRGVDARGNPSSLPEPENFETLQLQFAQDAIHAWRIGRYHLAQGKFRPETYSFRSDVAGLGTTRGDVIDVAHDLVEWGSGWGRVMDLSTNNSGQVIVTLDQRIVTDPNKSYSAQFRVYGGQSVVVPITFPGGESDSFLLQSLPSGVENGDACVIGESASVTEKLLVTGVSYSDGGQVTEFSAVRYDSRVGPFWSNPPTSITSEITGDIFSDVPPPIIVGVVSTVAASDTDDAGIAIPIIRIGIGSRSELHNRIEAIQ